MNTPSREPAIDREDYIAQVVEAAPPISAALRDQLADLLRPRHAESTMRTTKGQSMNVTATAQRSGDWWAITVPEVEGIHTQAKLLDQVADVAASAVADLLEIQVSDVKVDVVTVLRNDLSTAMTTHHLAAGSRAVCGQQIDGDRHAGWDATAFNGFELVNRAGRAEHVDLCNDCRRIAARQSDPSRVLVTDVFDIAAETGRGASDVLADFVDPPATD